VAFFWANQMNIKFIQAALWWLITLFIALWWLSPNQQYVSELEKVAAKCLSTKDQPIWIGGELHFCSSTPTGIKS
jgi:hypothetical protein